MGNGDVSITEIRLPEELVAFIQRNDIPIVMTDKEAELLLGYLTGHDYVVGFSEGQFYRGDLEEVPGEIVWDDHEYVVLNSIAQLDKFYEEITPYLETYDIPEDIFEDLINYQKNIIRTPFSEENTVSLKYDIHNYLKDVYVNNIHTLQKKEHTLVMRDSNLVADWKDFGKFVIWYGRMGWSSYKDDVKEI